MQVEAPQGGADGNSAGGFSSAGTGGDSSPAAGRSTGMKKEKKNYSKGPQEDRRNALRLGNQKKGRKLSGEEKYRRGSFRRRNKELKQQQKEEAAIIRRTVHLPEGPITVSALADLMEEKPVGLIKYLMTDLGIMAGMTQTLDQPTCAAVVKGFGKIVFGSEEDNEDDEDEYSDSDDDSDDDTDDDEKVIEEETALSIGYAMEEDEDPSDLISRPPVVTIMGHVDHGKTSLLDTLRNTKVTAGEAGGITQHIAAYQVEKNGQMITFVDTPGHAAFTEMRQRGADITDIVILVVAADDGVKPQTADSIACARQAGVPIIIAVNKIDLETADVDRVKADLTTYDVLTEDLGGDVLCAEISAKENINLDTLLEKVLLQAEILDLKANPNKEAQGSVIEARLQKGLGTVATTLINKGTIRVGDPFIAGATSGRVKALIGPDGKTRLKEAGPSTPVSVVGFDGVPMAGDLLMVCSNEQTARELAESRNRISREKDSASYQEGLMQSVATSFSDSFKEKREMCVVVKADVQGSAEALTSSLRGLKLENDEVITTIKIIVSEAGDITKSDVAVASVTPDTTIIAFNCGANYDATEMARSLGIPIEYYSIVYDAIDSVECRMQEVLSPTPEGEYVGSAIVQEVFNIGGLGNIGGSRCRDGILKKGSNVRVMRGDKILCESTIKSLRNFKAEVDKIESGDECGIGLNTFEEFEVDDIIESFVVQ